MIIKCLILVILAAKRCTSQEEEKIYRGTLLGSFTSYHHQISGDVYAEDDKTLLLVGFSYDGGSDDAFFWAGETGRPGPQGYIIPNEHGKTDVLRRYNTENVRLRLTNGRRVSRLRWIAVRDIGARAILADLLIPEGLEPPRAAPAPPLRAEGITSANLLIIDDNTVQIPKFEFDSSNRKVNFWVGEGAQPHSRGKLVPDEDGYLEPLRTYKDEDLTLRLPGAESVRKAGWLSVGSKDSPLAHSTLPSDPQVPPSKSKPHKHVTRLAHCTQLHADLQLAWEIFGDVVTMEIAARMPMRYYAAVGVAGKGSMDLERATEKGQEAKPVNQRAQNEGQMVGAYVTMVYFDQEQQRPIVEDYNITARAACTQVLGEWRGVCGAARGAHTAQVVSGQREDGVTVVSWRAALGGAWESGRQLPIVWAMGPLQPSGAPAFHTVWPRTNITIDLDKKPTYDDCFPLTVWTEQPAPVAAWDTALLADPAQRVMTFRIGPSGGARGLRGRKGREPPPPFAWYVNGQLAPDIRLVRGLQYKMLVFGGDDPHSATDYHPLVIRTLDGRPLAGERVTRRARPAPAVAGPLCKGTQGAEDPRRDKYPTFRAFNSSLVWACAGAQPGVLEVSPDTSWPDIAKYESFSTPGMGGRVFVSDRARRTSASHASGRAAGSLALTLPLMLVRQSAVSNLLPWNSI